MLLKGYLELSKPRILVMQFISLALGYFAALNSLHDFQWALFLWAILGTGLVAGGASAFNHTMEWKLDKRMKRTENRPIPSGLISPLKAGLFSWALMGLGCAVLSIFVTPLCAFFAGLTAVLYLAAYTPSKQKTWLNTYIGAIPGALPPLGGWAMVHTDVKNWLPWSLFALLFVWQLPHFFAIAWMYKDDYAQGGFKMLSLDDETGKKCANHTLWTTLALIGVALWPLFLQHFGLVYGVWSVVVGLWLLKPVWTFFKLHDKANARIVLKRSIAYLPLVLLGMIVDRLLAYL